MFRFEEMRRVKSLQHPEILLCCWREASGAVAYGRKMQPDPSQAGSEGGNKHPDFSLFSPSHFLLVPLLSQIHSEGTHNTG